MAYGLATAALVRKRAELDTMLASLVALDVTLRLFDPEVGAKPQIVAANKIDAVDDETRIKALERHVKKRKLPFHRISGVTGEGLDALLEAAWRQIAAVRAAEAEARPLDPSLDSGVDLLTPKR